MTQQDKRKWRELGNQTSEGEIKKVLDIFLTLDRIGVEHSMRTYKIPRRDRFILREQNRRLHNAVREYLHRLVEPSRSPF